MYTYVRATKLSDVGGRSDYITNKTKKHAEEDVLCVGGPTADWKPYAEYEKNHQKSAEQNNEGRELIVALPNAWGSLLAKPFVSSRVDSLARKLIGKDTDYQYAVHWNKGHTNLHVHIIFSERTRSPQNAAKWDRDIYYTADGKVARKKADRAVDSHGNVKPPIHRKGELKDPDGAFTVKDKRYKSKDWLQGVKKAVERIFALEGDKKHVTNYLHTYHEGKAPQASERVRELNAIIREANKMLDDFKKEGYVLKKEGDVAYREFYKRNVGEIEDGQSINEWFESNIALNADKMHRKQEREWQRIEKRADIEKKQKEIAIEYLDSLVSSDVYQRIERAGGVFEHMEAHLSELGLIRLDPKTYKKYQKYVNKYLSKEEQRTFKAEMIRTIANRSKPNSMYQAQTAEILNAYIHDYKLNANPISKLNNVELERQRKQRELDRQRSAAWANTQTHVKQQVREQQRDSQTQTVSRHRSRSGDAR